MPGVKDISLARVIWVGCDMRCLVSGLETVAIYFLTTQTALSKHMREASKPQASPRGVPRSGKGALGVYWAWLQARLHPKSRDSNSMRVGGTQYGSPDQTNALLRLFILYSSYIRCY